jgi:hypothetical protein
MLVRDLLDERLHLQRANRHTLTPHSVAFQKRKTNKKKKKKKQLRRHQPESCFESCFCCLDVANCTC